MQQEKEDIFITVLKHVFTCKFYYNLFYMTEEKIKTDGEIYLFADIIEIYKYIQNANRFLKSKIDLSESKLINEHSLILKEEINISKIKGNIKSDILSYIGKISEFNPVEIEKLSEQEKEAFYGREALVALNQNLNILSEDDLTKKGISKNQNILSKDNLIKVKKNK